MFIQGSRTELGNTFTRDLQARVLFEQNEIVPLTAVKTEMNGEKEFLKKSSQ